MLPENQDFFEKKKKKSLISTFYYPEISISFNRLAKTHFFSLSTSCMRKRMITVVICQFIAVCSNFSFCTILPKLAYGGIQSHSAGYFNKKAL